MPGESTAEVRFPDGGGAVKPFVDDLLGVREGEKHNTPKSPHKVHMRGGGGRLSEGRLGGKAKGPWEVSSILSRHGLSQDLGTEVIRTSNRDKDHVIVSPKRSFLGNRKKTLDKAEDSFKLNRISVKRVGDDHLEIPTE